VAAATRDIGGRRREPVLGAVAGHPPRDRPPEAPGDAADGALNVLVGIESKALGLDPARNRQGDNVEGAAAGAAMSTPSSPGPARPVSGRPCAGRTGRAMRQWRSASGWRWPRGWTCTATPTPRRACGRGGGDPLRAEARGGISLSSPKGYDAPPSVSWEVQRRARHLRSRPGLNERRFA
jgi:hypothetical protein